MTATVGDARHWRRLAAWALAQIALSGLRRGAVNHVFVRDSMAQLPRVPIPESWSPVLLAVSAAWWIVLVALVWIDRARWRDQLRAALTRDARGGVGAASPTDRIALFASLASFVALAAHFGAHRFRINWDCAYLLEAGRVLAEGGVLYRDFVDPNPPLIMLLMSIPARIAAASGIHLFTAFHFLVLACALASFLTIRHLLARAPEPLASRRDWVLLPFALFQLGLAYWNEFGQREHLFVIAAMPFFVARALRWEGEAFRARYVALALVAGLGACIKPHFFLVPLVMEAALALVHRRFRTLFSPEMWTFAAVPLAYLAWMWLGSEPVRTEYFGRWLPFFASTYYGMNTDLPRAWKIAPNLVVPAAFALMVARRAPGASARFAIGWFGAATGALAVFVAQENGFCYHIIPFAATWMMLLGALLATVRFRWSGVRAVSPAMVGLLAATGIILWPLWPGAWPDRGTFAYARERAEVIEKWSRPGESVLILSPSLLYAFPMARAMDRRPATRFGCLFMLGGLYGDVRGEPGAPFPYRTFDAATDFERAFLRDLASDIRRDRPRVVMIEHGSWCHGCPKGFDVFDYLSANGFVAGAMAEYRFLGRIPEFAVLVRADVLTRGANAP
ncbi:MAG: hypothetical protein IT350_11615 [Deltaproteobacteria bacterium]|nr:hypothetical protein [Deltaproteobacteria bacterium]